MFDERVVLESELSLLFFSLCDFDVHTSVYID